MTTQNNKHSKYSELEDIMYDLVFVGLPKDCAMVGGKIIAPERKKQFTENRNKQFDEAEKALTALINKEKAKAEKKLIADALRVNELYPGGTALLDFLYSRKYRNTTPEELEAQLAKDKEDGNG